MVRAADHLESPTVYRPAVISGDSNTGYTSTYHGLYLYLRLMALVVPRQPIGEDGLRHTPIRLPMSGDEPRNVVPVDWVAEVMTHLLNTPEARGGTYHLAPEVPLTPRAIIDACYKYFHSTGVQYVGQDYRHDPSDMSEFERLLLENITVYDAYTATDPVFDRTNLKRFASHLPCPTIDEATLHRYLTFAEEDRWGRKHQTDPQ